MNADGVKRAYAFKPNDSAVFEDQALERQLRAAAYLPTQPADLAAQLSGPGERRTPTFTDPRLSR